MRNYRLGRVNQCIDEAQIDIFQKANNRFWVNTNTTIELPSYDNDVIIVFTHILQHFFPQGLDFVRFATGADCCGWGVGELTISYWLRA